MRHLATENGRGLDLFATHLELRQLDDTAANATNAEMLDILRKCYPCDTQDEETNSTSGQALFDWTSDADLHRVHDVFAAITELFLDMADQWFAVTEVGASPDEPCRVFHLTPVEGLAIHIPGWLEHSVSPNLSSADRVSVAANLAVRPSGAAATGGADAEDQ